MTSRTIAGTFLLAVAAQLFVPTFQPSVLADDAAIGAALKARGAEITETQGAVTGVSFKAKGNLTGADLQQLKQLPHLKTFACGAGFDDEALAALSGLPELENFSSNGMDASDAGIRALGTCKKLHVIAFFHPGKKFTGSGLAALADLPAFERLTVAGSAEFADDGMVAVAQLSHLKEFRTWHSGITVEGVKKLPALKELKSLTLGQRLASKPPTALSDESVVVLANLHSLEALSLQEARLSLNALVQLKQIPHLKKLTFDGIDLTDADLTALRQSLPQTEIKWTAPNDAAKKRIDALFGAR